MRTRQRGELEREVLSVLWQDGGELSARDIQARLSGHTPAYTTLMTVLGRLEAKGQVVRSGQSPRKQRFAAAQSHDEHASSAMLQVLEASSDRQAALLAFAGNLEPEDVDVLRAVFGNGAAR